MAEFITKCPHCNVELQAQNEWIGMEAECPECGKSITIKKMINPENDSEETDIIKHLQYALIAIESKALQEAKKEFEFVLAKDNDNIQALYGIMICDAHLSSPEKSFLESIIFQYKKIEIIISQKQDVFTNSWSIEQLQERFISNMGSFIVNSYNNVISTLVKLREDARTREAINVLNAYTSNIVLSNPEALKASDAGKILFPYLEQILAIRKFIISLLNIDEISKKTETLALAKQIFESTWDMSKEDPETIIAYNTICKTYEIKTIVNELQCSEQDAKLEYERRHTSPPMPWENFTSKFSSLTWLMLALGAILFNAIWSLSGIALAKADIFIPLLLLIAPVYILGFGSVFLFMQFALALRLEKRRGIQIPFYSKVRYGYSLFKKYWICTFLIIIWIITFIAAMAKAESILGSAFCAFVCVGMVYAFIWFMKILIAFAKMKL